MLNLELIIKVTTTLMMISGVIAMFVSLLTEFFIKKLFKIKEKTINAVVAIMSIAATVICCIVYIQINQILVEWYGWIGFITLGFLTASISMNGYDKVFSYMYKWLSEIFRKEEHDD